MIQHCVSEASTLYADSFGWYLLPPAGLSQERHTCAASITCMVSVGVQVTTVETRMCEVLIQSLSLPKVDPRVVSPQPVAILHLCLPGHVYQL